MPLTASSVIRNWYLNGLLNVRCTPCRRQLNWSCTSSVPNLDVIDVRMFSERVGTCGHVAINGMCSLGLHPFPVVLAFCSSVGSAVCNHVFGAVGGLGICIHLVCLVE